MQSQYSGLLQLAAFNNRTNRIEMKAVASDMSPQDFLSGVSADDTSPVQDYFSRTPWLYRGIELRANAVSAMPFRIMRGETELDNSETWQNKVGFLADPASLLWLTEAALCLWGTCYYWRERNAAKALGVRYIIPSTIEPQLSDTDGLVGFVRNLGTRKITASTDDIVWFWKPDPYVEIGPPKSSPVQAALSAAGVLYNIDAFAEAFFKRGAIKATLLTVEGMTTEQEKNRLKEWWRRAVGGIGNAFNANVFNAIVKPVTVGEGLESLKSNTLIVDKRADVATALGIPQTVLFSSDASGLGGGGVVRQDDVHFYDKTIVSECRFIAGVLNAQVFAPLGLRLDFQPETLDVFQADENNRADAYSKYVAAGLPHSLVAEMLGLELPVGWDYDDLDPGEPEPQPMAAEQEPPGEDINAQVDAIVEGITREGKSELYQWRRWASKRAGGDLTGFQVNGHLPEPVVSEIAARLATATTKDAVSAAFEPWLEDAVKAQSVEPDRAAEDALQRKIAAVLKAQRERIAALIMDGAEIDWAAIAAELQAAVMPTLANAATQQAVANAAALGIPIDIAKANVAALSWAQAYSYELVKGITDTSRNLIAKVIAQFTATPGMTIGDVAGLLEGAFGPMRAQMIAVTETTRAYSAAGKITQDMLRDMGVNTVRVWQTSADEKVCEICGPLDGKTEDDWDVPDGPPAHVNCRCWTTSKVVRS